MSLTFVGRSMVFAARRLPPMAGLGGTAGALSRGCAGSLNGSAHFRPDSPTGWSRTTDDVRLVAAGRRSETSCACGSGRTLESIGRRVLHVARCPVRCAGREIAGYQRTLLSGRDDGYLPRPRASVLPRRRTGDLGPGSARYPGRSIFHAGGRRWRMPRAWSRASMRGFTSSARFCR